MKNLYKKKYRILFLPSWYSYNKYPHSGSFFKDQAMSLKKIGLSVHLLYVEPRSIRELSIKGLRENHFQIKDVYEEGLLTFRVKGWNSLLNLKLGGMIWAHIVKRFFKKYLYKYGRPDIIHAHGALWAGYAAYLIQNELGVPYVITEHSSIFMKTPKNSLKKNLNKIFNNASSVISVSKALAFSMKRYSSNTKIKIIPNTVDTDFFSLPIKHRSKIRFTFLSISNLNHNKGIHILLKAFALKFRGNNCVCLMIAGEGVYKKQLHELSKRFGISQNVQFIGRIDRFQVREVLWSANALVLASFKETFGVILIEALSTGLPVIASKSGGPEDIVNKEVGFLFDPGDVKELGRLMENIYKNCNFSENDLRKHAKNNYGMLVIAERLKRTYQSITT